MDHATSHSDSVQDSGPRWVNVALATSSRPGWEYWLPADGFGISTHKSVSGSANDGWRVWHVGCAPGAGQFFSSKRAAFTAAEELRR